jgi:hypothetical protein
MKLLKIIKYLPAAVAFILFGLYVITGTFPTCSIEALEIGFGDCAADTKVLDFWGGSFVLFGLIYFILFLRDLRKASPNINNKNKTFTSNEEHSDKYFSKTSNK